MKKALMSVAFGLSALATTGANAALASGNFQVQVDLTPRCLLNSDDSGVKGYTTGTLISNILLDYTSFQTTPATGSTSFFVKCTSGLPYEITLNNKDGLEAASVTDDVVGLPYTLNLSSNPTHAQGSIGGLLGLTGTGSDVPYYVHATIDANLSGQCPVGGGGNCSNLGSANNTKRITIRW